MTKEYERYNVDVTQNAEDDLNEIIMYIANDTVNVLTIIDSRRNLQDILIKKLLK
jgi:hypothetical protein